MGHIKVGGTKNLGTYIRNTGQMVWRQYFVDDENTAPNYVKVWISELFAPNTETNFVDFIYHPLSKGWEWGYGGDDAKRAEIADDFADVFAFMQENYKNPDLTPEKFKQILWEKFDFADM